MPHRLSRASVVRVFRPRSSDDWFCDPEFPMRTQNIFARGHFFEEVTRRHLISTSSQVADAHAVAPAKACFSPGKKRPPTRRPSFQQRVNCLTARNGSIESIKEKTEVPNG
jgi:hypothetical protein